MNEIKQIYFDNAATTYPKPLSVLAAADDCARSFCGNSGRGGHYYAARSAEAVYGCRQRLADFFGLKDPENVVFTLNATHALNLAANAMLCRGDHVLISNLEHNALLRPIAHLKRLGVIDYDVFEAHLGNAHTLASLKSKIRKNTAAVFCTALSNIAPIAPPLALIGRLCRACGIAFVVDAAQGAPCLDVNIERECITALALPSHKGLYGIQGAGALLVSEPKYLKNDTVQGGSGFASRELEMPRELPERYEAGTLPTPALHALSAGLDFVKNTGPENIARHETRLARILCDYLYSNPRATLYGIKKNGAEDKLYGTVCFNLSGHSSEELAGICAKHGYCLRGGLHCAPLAHKTLGTPPDGALRASFSVFNTEAEVYGFCEFLDKL